jgi:hypothetical protein
MHLCTHCRRPTPVIVKLPTLVVRQTFSSPAEYDELELCPACYDTLADPDYEAHCVEQESLRGLSDKEREQI